MDKILVTKSSMPPLNEYIEEIQSIWESHWLTNMGPKHALLQKELLKFLKISCIDLLTNGHMALELSMQAMNLTGEVITTPFTFASTTHAIIRNGLKPVFCDINKEDFTIDPKSIEKLITDKTSAIIPVHVYGNVCNVDEIKRIADKYGLKVIYDAAHAFGVEYKDQGIGAFGDASCFSFHATKVFNCIEGGAVSFSDIEFGKRLYELKNFGIHGPEEVLAVGANAKMNEFCAAMGICNLRHLDSEINCRRLLVERYRENLKDVEGIYFSPIQNNVKQNYSYFPIVVDELKFGLTRNEVCSILVSNEIYPRKYFYPITSSFPCVNDKFDVNETPNALYISLRVLTLPLYSSLSLDQIDKICEIIKKAKK